MMLFGALVSTPVAENMFLTVGPALFYFGTRENGWASLFYGDIPRHFAPGWGGRIYQKEVIEPLYTGGVSLDQIPWHGWLVLISAWSVFLLLAYVPMEWMTSALFGTATIGLSNLTKLSFLQATIMTDMRTNLLPGFLHTLKMAHERGLCGVQVRRLMMAVAAAVAVAMAVTIFTTVATLYSKGALASYAFSATLGPQRVFTGAATVWRNGVTLEPNNLGWMALGAAIVWLLLQARSHFLWFPLHPLGYIVAPTYGITKLWFSFFVGWLVKALIMRYGKHDAYVAVRPFMIGMIFGNAAAMVF